MLLKKNLGNAGSKEKRTIGLIGVNRGAGVTYTGMLLAHYFGTDKRINTAFLECNSHMDFERLQNAYEWCKEDVKSFCFDRITYFKQVESYEISEILSDDYGYYILDFGTDFSEWEDEFLRCGTKIIIGDRAIWNQSKAEELIKSLDNIKGSRTWTYMIPCADNSVLRGISHKTDRSFVSIPYEPDPTLLSKETHKLFMRLFG